MSNEKGIRLEDSVVYQTGGTSMSVTIPATIRNTIGVEVGDVVERYWDGKVFTIRFKKQRK